MAEALEDLLKDLKNASDDRTTSVGDVIDTFEHRSLGVVLTVFAAIAALPVVGAIPGVSILTGALIILAVAQSFFASSGLWAPDRVRRLEVDDEDFHQGVDKALPYARKIDNVLRPRMRELVDGRAQTVLIALCSLLLSLTFVPLAVVPWGVQVPALAILAFGLALIGKDGYFAAGGYVLSALTAYLIRAFAL